MFMIRKPWPPINQQASLTRGLLGTPVCLQNTHALMFPLNTIIAWDVNIYHKHRDILITILLLPLGHISNSLPLALESIIQLTLLRSNTHGLLVTIMFAYGRGFSQRVWNIQNRIVFCNSYTSPRITHFEWHIRLHVSLISEWVGIALYRFSLPVEP